MGNSARCGLDRCYYRNLDSQVLMVQPSEERQRGDSTHALNRSSDRRVLAKSEMSPRLIVIDGVGAKDAAQVRFAEY